MGTIRTLWRHFYDVRPGEYGRTIAMFFYLLCVLFAYYIIKPVSRALFLNKFDIDKLPQLYILIAIFGGLLAYLYSRAAVRASLQVAVAWTVALSVGSLVVMWWLIRMRLAWMIYVLNIWVGLFSIVLVSQGWLVASNLFTAREAKRLYGLLGMAMVIGAAFGGEFTSRTAVLVGTNNLLLASAVMVILAYIAFRVAAAQSGASLSGARASEAAEEFSLGGLLRDIGRTRHLQVIIAMMTVTYLVDVMVEFQFQYMAKQAYHGDQLTAFFGSFYGLWLNGAEFVFQFFLTTAVVSFFGVGRTLQILPVSIMLSSLASVFAPGVVSTAGVRLTEASMRYTMNKTGMELLYMPLPRELRNRVKAFIDIFVDRMSRGLGGLLLLFMVSVLNIQGHTGSHGAIQRISLVVMLLTIPWILLSLRASKEYVATIRKRIASRQLDLESTRVRVTDAETIRVLEEAAKGANPRQATYALSLLAQAPDYDVGPLLRLFADSPIPEVRRAAYELARIKGDGGLIGKATADIPGPSPDLSRASAAYVMAVSPEPLPIAHDLLESGNYPAAVAVLESLTPHSAEADQLLSNEWIEGAAGSSDPQRRSLAALAIGVAGGEGSAETLRRLLQDPDRRVIVAACRAAGRLGGHTHLLEMVRHLSNAHVRGAVMESIAALGSRVCGTLGDLLLDETVPLKLRRQVPRVLKLIPDQRSVEVLLYALDSEDLTNRAPVLKALNHLRENAPGLRFNDSFVTRQIFKEAGYYFEFKAALAPFTENNGPSRPAASLLARSIEEQLRRTLERVFRLLGLRYPPKDIYSAYLAVSGKRAEEVSAAEEFLDSVLDRDLKKTLLSLLDESDSVLTPENGRFGVAIRDTESALRELIHSRDPWLAACAMAAAAELGLRQLAPEIAEVGRHSLPEVSEVARSAELILV
jgi:ATP:ADP antiporter, AAA family